MILDDHCLFINMQRNNNYEHVMPDWIPLLADAFGLSGTSWRWLLCPNLCFTHNVHFQTYLYNFLIIMYIEILFFD